MSPEGFFSQRSVNKKNRLTFRKMTAALLIENGCVCVCVLVKSAAATVTGEQESFPRSGCTRHGDLCSWQSLTGEQ